MAGEVVLCKHCRLPLVVYDDPATLDMIVRCPRYHVKYTIPLIVRATYPGRYIMECIEHGLINPDSGAEETAKGGDTYEAKRDNI